MTIKSYAMDLLHKVSKLMIKMMMMMRRLKRRRIIRMTKKIRQKLNLLGRI